ncbi:MAG TPA: hypothetical protein ENK18_04685 [Deltaproteobacteria bacterium]|nr:hypothetical protein [Deltaproteobacteria bacterium]
MADALSQDVVEGDTHEVLRAGLRSPAERLGGARGAVSDGRRDGHGEILEEIERSAATAV